MVVFIPGGTFVVGSSEAQLYGPQILLERDLVLVGVNYRQDISNISIKRRLPFLLLLLIHMYL